MQEKAPPHPLPIPVKPSANAPRSKRGIQMEPVDDEWTNGVGGGGPPVGGPTQGLASRKQQEQL